MSTPAFLSLALALVLFASPAPAQTWTQTVKDRPVSPRSPIVESVWTASRPPNGEYDRIALRRFVKPGLAGTERPVFMYLPGTNMNGAAALTEERHNLWIYLASRGIDVYTMDYRTSAVPENPPADLSFMQGWTYGAFVEDIAEAVAQARQISGRDRVFLAGFSRGVSLAYLYAAERWRTDLCGLVMLDGGLKAPRPSGAFDLEKARAELTAQKRFASDVSGRTGWTGRQELMRRASSTPPGPATDPKFRDAAEQLASVLYNAWRPGGLANAVNGYSDAKVLATLLAGYDRFYPAIQDIEGRALSDFDDHPALPYDDKLLEVDVPVLTFNSTGMGVQFLLSGISTAERLATDDVSVHVLEGYGHLDVLVGTRAAEEVFEPTYRWIQSRAGCRVKQ